LGAEGLRPGLTFAFLAQFPGSFGAVAVEPHFVNHPSSINLLFKSLKPAVSFVSLLRTVCDLSYIQWNGSDF
jgi:hypothetical protein